MTGQSMLDVWTIVHLAFWLVVGAQLQPLGVSRTWALSGMYVVAGLWECFERIAFARWPNLWKRPESWANATIGDVALAGTLGVLLGYWLVERQ